MWAASIGLITSALLLHVFRVHSMAVRYALGAAAVYFVGFVLAGWWYAKWWNSRKNHAVGEVPVHATADEQIEYDQRQDAIRKKFEPLSSIGGGGGDDPLSALLAVIGLIVLLVVFVCIAGYLPILATDALAGYLAEIVLEFVIGGLLLRRVLKPRSMDDYWGFAIRNTWLPGVFAVIVFGCVGYALQALNPEANTLLEALRQNQVF